MYFLYMLFLILGIVFVLVAIMQFIFAYTLWKASNNLKEELKEYGVEAAIKLLENSVAWLRILFKILPFLRSFFKKKVKDNIVPAIRKICIQIIISAIGTATMSISLFSISSSFHDMYVMQTTAATIVNDLLAKEDPTPEELEENGWQWDSVGDSYTYPGGGGSGGDNGSGNSMGNATGDYAVQLDDGSYYWYHQGGSSGDGCVFCGDWTTAQWGATNFHSFGSDGCAVYSLAIITSNLVGYPVTPMDLLGTCFGCEITDEGGVKKVNTTNSSVFDGRGIYRDVASQKISDMYGLTVTTKARGAGITDTEEINFIDSILDQGGLVWGYWVDSECQWCGNGTKHFMAIRKKDGSNYYCFTSCKGKCATSGGKAGAVETMNFALDKYEVVSGFVDGAGLYGFVNPNPPGGTGGGSGGGGGGTAPPSYTSTDLYNKLASNPTYSAKAEILTAAYDAAQPLYGESFAIGLMANILAEGNVGIVEGMWSRDNQPLKDDGTPNTSYGQQTCNCNGNQGKWVRTYWLQVSCDVHALDYKKIDSMDDVDLLLTIPNGVGGIGVGHVQWSGGRRVNILTKYKQMASTFTDNELQLIELSYMLDEFAGGYEDVVTACEGQTAAVCASKICLNYEKPENSSTKAVERANVASTLETFLHSE